MSMDLDETLTLLRIVEKTRDLPFLQPLHDTALDALRKMSDEEGKHRAEEKKVADQKAAEEKAMAEAQAKKDAEDQARADVNQASMQQHAAEAEVVEPARRY